MFCTYLLDDAGDGSRLLLCTGYDAPAAYDSYDEWRKSESPMCTVHEIVDVAEDKRLQPYVMCGLVVRA